MHQLLGPLSTGLANSQQRADGKQQLSLVEVLRAYDSSSRSKEGAGGSSSVLSLGLETGSHIQF